MIKLIEVTAGAGGNAFLILTKSKSGLYDTGMAYCATKLIENIKNQLNGKDLDYILLSHSHYDHVGGVPYLKAEYPNVKVIGAEYAQYVLTRPNALATINLLSKKAGSQLGANEFLAYDEDLLKIDITVKQGDVIDLGEEKIKVLETQGHTQCSLTYIVDDKWILASESTCCKGRSVKVYAAYITSCANTITSLYNCVIASKKAIGVLVPHYKLLEKDEMKAFWRDSFNEIISTRDFIINEYKNKKSIDEIFENYKKVFRDDNMRKEQPEEAFKCNTYPMIQHTIREYESNIYSPHEKELKEILFNNFS